MNSTLDLDLANFYAVELLHAVFNLVDPIEQEITKLERQLTKRVFHLTHQLYYSRHPKRLRILIVSSNSVEQNTLRLMLEDQNHFVDQARDKTSFLQFLSERKPYDVVIVSDHFDSVGLGFSPLYFRAGLSKRRPRLIYLGEEEGVRGFDAHLKHPFLTETLLTLLRNLSKGILG